MLNINDLTSDRHKNVTALNRLLGSKPPLENWFANGSNDLQTQRLFISLGRGISLPCVGNRRRISCRISLVLLYP